MIKIATLLLIFFGGFCMGVVLFIILGYVFVKSGKIEELIKPKE